MSNKYGYIPTKEYPLTCLDVDCGAPAYHLSTVNDHPISTVSADGKQLRSKTVNVRCRSGHTLSEVRTYETNVYDGALAKQ